MPQNNKTIEKNIRSLIKSINKKTGANLSYSKLYNQIDSMLKIEDETERENAFVAFHIANMGNVSEKLLAKKGVFSSNIVIAEKYMYHDAMRYSITDASSDVHSLTGQFLSLIVPDEKYIMNHRQLDAIHEYEMSVLKSHNYYAEIPKCLKEWNYKCYHEEIKDVDSIFKDHTYSANIKNSLDIAMADLYYKTTLIRAELEGHGAIWRFFNFRKVAAYRTFTEKVDATLREHGFDAATHGEESLEFLKNTIMPPHDLDVEHVAGERDTAKRYYSEVTTERITLAKEKVAHARELDKTPETSFRKKIEPFVAKYNFDAKSIDLGINDALLNNAAEKYDNSRNLDDIKRVVTAPFYKSLFAMIQNAMKTGAEINLAQMIGDARKIAVMAAQHYTPFFEVKEFANIEMPIYMNNVTENWIVGRINYYSNETLDALSNEENNAIQNGNPVPEHIAKAKEALSPEKIEALKNHAIEVVKQLRSDFKTLLDEDRKLASELGAKLYEDPSIENGQNPQIIEEPKDAEKERISVNLDAKIEEGFKENNNVKNAPAVEEKGANDVSHKQV